MELEGFEPLSVEDFRRELWLALKRTAPWMGAGLVVALVTTALVFNSRGGGFDPVGDPVAAVHRYYPARAGVSDVRCEPSSGGSRAVCTYTVERWRCAATVANNGITVGRCGRR